MKPIRVAFCFRFFFFLNFRRLYFKHWLLFFILGILSFLQERIMIHQLLRIQNLTSIFKWLLSCLCKDIFTKNPFYALFFNRFILFHNLTLANVQFFTRCDADLLVTTLCSRSIQTREGIIVKFLDCEAAAANRDALAKTVYSKLFDWHDLFSTLFVHYFVLDD